MQSPPPPIPTPPTQQQAYNYQPMMMVPMQMSQYSVPQSADIQGGLVQSRQESHAEKYDGFDTAAKELTLAPELVKELPRNVREWQSVHTQKWLEDVFMGAEDLNLYLDHFRRLGIKGVDLLASGTNQLSQFGITSPVHVSRATTCLAQLVNYQKTVDAELVAQQALEKAESAYFETEKKYVDLVKRTPNYQLPKKMELWTRVDLFYFLKKEENYEHFHAFLKPVAMSKLDGKDLLAKFSKEDKIELPGLVAEDHERSKFKALFFNKKRKMDELVKRVRDERQATLRRGLPKIEHGKLDRRNVLGKGAYGTVYLAYYEKRKVVVKMLTAKPTAQGDAQAEEAAIQQRSSDLMYEASMLMKSAGSGVVQLIALDEANNPPMMITEYMCKKSVEDEYRMAENNDEESIFHPRNHSNLSKAESGISNPVLLQKVRIARDVASALARLHSKGIIHLDIAARNILLDAGKRPKIADFGCATIESDMLQQYKRRKAMLEEMGGFTGEGSVEEFNTSFEIQMEQLEASEVDEHAVRKFKMHTQERPIRWMPEWVVKCGVPANPNIDRHADVYSFGCLMYEMAQHNVPHFSFTDEEVLKFKLTGNGNPPVPPELDSRYAQIMSACWDIYDEQPTMAVVAKQLTDLHKLLVTESFEMDLGYMELKDLTVSPMTQQIPGANVSSVYGSIATTQAKMIELTTAPSTTDRASMSERPDRASLLRPKPSSYPIIAGGRIRLQFPSFVDVNDVDKLFEYEDAGISKDKLANALYCAFRYHDHSTIALYMECVRVENDHSQVEIITTCFDYLEGLAKDEHGSTDDEDAWRLLCVKIIRVIHSVVKFAGGIFTSQLDRTYVALILQHALSAIASLLSSKVVQEVSASEDDGFSVIEKDLREILVGALRNFSENERLVENAASAISCLADLSAQVPGRLHAEGLIGILVDSVARHAEDTDCVIGCVKAFRSFPVTCLVDPRPDQSQLKGISAASPAVSATGGNFSPKRNGAVLPLPIDYSAITSKFGEVFDCLVGVIRRCSTISNEFSEEDEEVELALEAALITLYRTCEKAVLEPHNIERFLFSVTPDVVGLLFQVIRAYPDHFRIQEGAIGMLSHIVNTGQGLLDSDIVTVSNSAKNAKMRTLPVTINPTVVADDRLNAVLRCDPALRLLLSAMEKFSLDDNISICIREPLVNHHQHNSVSQGVYRSQTKSNVSNSRTSRTSRTAFGGSSKSMLKSRTTRSAVTDQDELWQELEDEFEKGIREQWMIDEEGEQISAASLQKSVAMILGIACNKRKDVQDNLVRSRYNELILLAFKNFWHDIHLIQFGCHALFSTCRRHSMHQRKLHELRLLKNLCLALNNHKKIWSVVDGIICTIIGLLEPPEPSKQLPSLDSGSTTTNTTPVLSAAEEHERRINSDCHMVAEELTRTVGNMSLLKKLTFMVAEFQMNSDSHSLVSNFMKLLSCLIYWRPLLLSKWNAEFINLEESSTFVASLVKKLFKTFVRDLGRDFYKKNNGTASSSKSGSISPKKLGEAQNEKAGIVDTIGSLDKCSLLQFAMLSIRWHADQPHVLAAGLGIVTTIISRSVNAPVAYGDALPYASNSKLTEMREQILQSDLLQICLDSAQLGYPILIRYSLLLQVLLISQDRKAGLRVSAAFDDKLGAVDDVSAEIAIKGGIEWAIEVINKFKNFYSLQCLAVIFLTRMEHHGHLSKRDESKLRLLKAALLEACGRSLESFLSLEEEGHDTNVIGATIEKYGNLTILADRLLRAVENHLPQEKPVEEPVQWDGECLPHAISVVSNEIESDPDTNKPYAAYVIEVKWDENTTWRLTRRFRYFLQLEKDLNLEFAHITTIPAIGNKHTLLSKVNNPEFLESRRQLLNAWLTAWMQVRAVRFSPIWRTFLEVEEHAPVGTIRSPRFLAQLQPPSERDMGVNAMHYDSGSDVLFVGLGVPVGPLVKAFGNKATLRGALFVYHKLLSADSPYAYDTLMQRDEKYKKSTKFVAEAAVCVQRYNTGVETVSFNPKQRAVYVGLSTGPIVFYHLSPAAPFSLTYVAELNFHMTPPCRLVADSLKETFVSAARGGTLAAYNTAVGSTSAQGVRRGVQYTALAYMPAQHWACAGTAAGAVYILNLNVNPPSLIHEINVKADGVPGTPAVVALDYLEETRLVYIAAYNHIKVYSLKCSGDSTVTSAVWKVLSLSATSRISSMAVLEGGKYVAASSDASASVAIFDLTDRASKAAAKVAATSQKDSLATSTANLVPWTQIVHASNPEMRDWLRGKGVDSAAAGTRADILQLVLNVSGKNADDLAVQLRPADPAGDVVFAWKLNDDKARGSRPHVVSTVWVPESRTIAFGCADGIVHLVSLADFLVTTSHMLHDLHKHRADMLALTVDSSASQIKGAAKSNTGKNHQLQS